MAIHKIQINDFITNDYELIAIHTAVEDYKLAFLLNSILGTKFKKNSIDIEISISEGKGLFTNFLFEDHTSDIIWSLIENKAVIFMPKKEQFQLFDAVEMAIFLIPEFKKADFILKIENNNSNFNAQELINRILSIKNISTVYTIDAVRLKSKNNLIF